VEANKNRVVAALRESVPNKKSSRVVRASKFTGRTNCDRGSPFSWGTNSYGVFSAEYGGHGGQLWIKAVYSGGSGTRRQRREDQVRQGADWGSNKGGAKRKVLNLPLKNDGSKGRVGGMPRKAVLGESSNRLGDSEKSSRRDSKQRV